MQDLWLKLRQLSAANQQLFLNQNTAKVLYFDDETDYDELKALRPELDAIE